MEAPAPAKTISDGHHPHPLHLRSKPRLFTCDRCKCRGYGRRYVCKDCRVAMHELCATCPDSLDFFMHPDHTLTLQRSHNPFARHTCEACGDPVHGYFFRCKPCSFELHPFCSLLRPAIADDAHPGHTLRYEKGGSAPCVVCGEGCSGWRYACRECPADVHLKCLSIVDSPGEDEDETKRRRRREIKNGLKIGAGVAVMLAVILVASMTDEKIEDLDLSFLGALLRLETVEDVGDDFQDHDDDGDGAAKGDGEEGTEVAEEGEEVERQEECKEEEDEKEEEEEKS